MNEESIKVDVDVPVGLEKFSTLRDVLHDVVKAAGLKGLKQKELSEKLGWKDTSRLGRSVADNPDDVVFFPVDKLLKLMQITDDLRPIYWLVYQLFVSKEDRQKQARDRVVDMLPALIAALKASGMVDALEAKPRAPLKPKKRSWWKFWS